MTGYDANKVVDAHIYRVDKELWQRFRRLCQLEGKSATQKIKEMISQELERKEEK